jgi:hypothetical protein
MTSVDPPCAPGAVLETGRRESPARRSAGEGKRSDSSRAFREVHISAPVP